MKLNELPNELLLEIFAYLLLFDIGFLLIDACNRLGTLFSKKINYRRTLRFTVGGCSHSNYQAFSHDHKGFRTSLNIFLRSISLDALFAAHTVAQILERWADNQTFSFLPLARHLTLFSTYYMQFLSMYQRSLVTTLVFGRDTNIIGQLDKLTLSVDNPMTESQSIMS